MNKIRKSELSRSTPNTNRLTEVQEKQKNPSISSGHKAQLNFIRQHIFIPCTKNIIQMKHIGSCLCGAVTFEIEGDFDRFFLCHCSRCRKDTGSAHAANLFSSSASLKWLSGEEQVKTFQLPESRHSKSFCSKCGSALPRAIEGGKRIIVPAGCLDTDIQIKPDAHIFIDSKANWDNELEKIRRFDQLPE